MKSPIVIFALLLLGTVTYGFTPPPQKCNTKANGGLCIKKGGKEFVEANVHQFRIEVDYSIFDSLMVRFRRDSANNVDNYGDMTIAGFCFIPIIEEITVNPPVPNTMEYKTTGIRVVLTLWQPELNPATQRYEPRSVRLYGFNSIDEPFTLSPNIVLKGISPYYFDLITK